MNYIKPIGLPALLAILIALPLAALPGLPGQASSTAAIQVNSYADEMVENGSCSLREALLAANTDRSVDACPAGSGTVTDTILLPEGDFHLEIVGTGENVGLTGDLDILGSVHILGAGMEKTVLDGAGLDRVFHIVSEVPVEIGFLTIQYGYAVDSVYGGGGILNGGGELTLESVTVQNNQAVRLGGGLDNVGTATIRNSAFSGNQAQAGGGIFNDGTVTLVNDLLAGNTAHATGGALDNGSSATLVNCTLSGNTAESGGGIFSDKLLTIRNSTLVENSNAVVNNGSSARFINTLIANSTAGVNCGGRGTFTSEGHNLESGDSCNFIAASDQIDIIDPGIGLLAENEGALKTHALLAGSPAIDSGDGVDCAQTDQRGAVRPADGNNDGVKVCDIGAYEFQAGFPLPVYLPILAKR